MSIRTLLRSKKVPQAAKDAFKLAIVSESAEQALWREAAIRHTLDAFGVVGIEKGERTAIEDARRWFRDCYDDVQLLFEFAGVDPAPVLRSLEDVLCQKAS